MKKEKEKDTQDKRETFQSSMDKERQDLLFQSFIEKDGIFDLNFSMKKRKRKRYSR